MVRPLSPPPPMPCATSQGPPKPEPARPPTYKCRCGQTTGYAHRGKKCMMCDGEVRVSVVESCATFEAGGWPTHYDGPPVFLPTLKALWRWWNHDQVLSMIGSLLSKACKVTP